MELQIITKSITVMATSEVNGNTAEFSWYYEDGQIPAIINFSIKRGKAGDNEFTGNQIITGSYYSESGKFDVNNNNFKEGDLVMYQEILDACKEITSETN